MEKKMEATIRVILGLFRVYILQTMGRIWDPEGGGLHPFAHMIWAMN